MQLSARGAAFLEHARELLKVHDRALAVFAGARQRLTIGISDHVAGPELPALIARMNAQDPQLLIENPDWIVGRPASKLRPAGLDTVIVRLHVGRSDGELLTEEKFGSDIARASPYLLLRWPGSFSMRQACPGQKFSSLTNWPDNVILNSHACDTHINVLAFAPVYVTGEIYGGNTIWDWTTATRAS